MNEEQFLAELEAGMKNIPPAERQEMLADFKEHFAMGKEAGKTEADIAADLGTPDKIAREMVAQYHLEKAETNATAGNVLRAVWAGIGLGFFNLVIVLGPLIGVLGVVFGGWVTGVTFIGSPILVVLSMLIIPGANDVFDLFISIALSGLGIFIVIGMYYVTKWLVKGLIHYLKFNISLVKGGAKS